MLGDMVYCTALCESLSLHRNLPTVEMIHYMSWYSFGSFYVNFYVNFRMAESTCTAGDIQVISNVQNLNCPSRQCFVGLHTSTPHCNFMGPSTLDAATT